MQFVTIRKNSSPKRTKKSPSPKRTQRGPSPTRIQLYRNIQSVLHINTNTNANTNTNTNTNANLSKNTQTIITKYNENNENSENNTNTNTNLSENNENTTECCICMTQYKQKCALTPCGHTQMCFDCYNKLQKKKCPLCNTQINSIIKLYL